MKRNFLIVVFAFLVSSCSTQSNSSSSQNWFDAYGLVTDSLTEYIEYQPSRSATFEENITSVSMRLSKLKTAQMAFEKYNQNSQLTLSDGTISADSVIALNQSLSAFVQSQEDALQLLQSCEEFSNESESRLCFLLTFDQISSETKARYSDLYLANQAFLQDSTD